MHPGYVTHTRSWGFHPAGTEYKGFRDELTAQATVKEQATAEHNRVSLIMSDFFDPTKPKERPSLPLDTYAGCWH
jgi:uncharacterized membrane-anchored protein